MKKLLTLILPLLFVSSCSESIDIRIGEEVEIFEEQWLTCVMDNGDEANFKHTEDAMIGVGKDTVDTPHSATFVKEDKRGYRYFKNPSIMHIDGERELTVEMQYHPVFKDLVATISIKGLEVSDPEYQTITTEGRCYLPE